MHSAFIYRYGHLTRASLIVKWVKNLPAMQETQELPVPSVGQEDSLEKAIATHSNILAWEIPWSQAGYTQQGHKESDTTEWLLLSHVRLFVTPWTAAHQASLSFTISWSFLKLMSIELVMPSNHIILGRSLLLLPSIFPSIRVFRAFCLE